jgi:hypothetical protein
MGRNQRRRVRKRKGDAGIAGVAWYRRDQWGQLRAASVDGDTLDERYDDWLSRAEKNLRALQQRGVTTRLVDVELDELLRWCHATGRRLDAPARAAYAAERLRAEHDDGEDV